MRNISKDEFAAALQQRSDILKSKAAALRMLDDFGAVIAEILHEDYKVTIPGVGALYLADVAAKVGRNPKTGETVDIPEHKAVKFRVSKTMKDSLK